MKHIYDFMKKTLLTGALLLSVTSAFGYGDSYYGYNVGAKAQPSGAGKVYFDPDSYDRPTTDQYQDEVVFDSYKSQSDGLYVTLYAQPAEGWIFAGWSDDEGKTLFSNDPEGSYTFPSEMEGVETEEQVMYPDETTWVQGYFTHLAIGYDVLCSTLGNVSIDKIVNYVGDEVTLTATPLGESTFEKWTCKETGETFDTPQLTLTVKDTCHYLATFGSELRQSFELSEDHFIPFADSTYYWSIDNAETFKPYYFNANQIYHTATGDTLCWSDEVVSTYYLSPGSGYLMKGTGTHYILKDTTTYSTSEEVRQLAEEETTTSDWLNLQNQNILLSSGDNDLNVSDLDESCRYYNYDAEKEVFNITTTTIPANSVFLAVPTSLSTGDLIVLTEGQKITVQEGPQDDGYGNIVYDIDYSYFVPAGSIPTAVNSVKAAQTTSTVHYNLAGQRVNANNRGVQIVAGKKYLNK